MAAETADHVAALEREVARLEELLATDVSWRRLKAIETRQTERGLLGTIEEALERQELQQRLGSHRVYAARQRLLEAIALLSGAAEPLDAAAVARLGASPRSALGQRLVDRLATASAEATASLRAARAPEPAAAASGAEPSSSAPAEQPGIGDATGRPLAKAAPAPAAQVPQAAGKMDDLTAIRGIDAETAARLAGLEVTTYAQIAGWTRAEARRVRDALALKKRIWRDGWIEQAAVLAAGRETAFSAARRRQHVPAARDEDAQRAAALFVRPRTYPPGRSLLAAIEAAEASLRRGGVLDAEPRLLREPAIAPTDRPAQPASDMGELATAQLASSPPPPRRVVEPSASLAAQANAPTVIAEAASPPAEPAAAAQGAAMAPPAPAVVPSVTAPVQPVGSTPAGSETLFPSAPRLPSGRPPLLGAAPAARTPAPAPAGETSKRPEWLDREAAARTVPLLFEEEADVAIVFHERAQSAGTDAVPAPAERALASAAAPAVASAAPPQAAPPPAAYTGLAEEASVEIVRIDAEGRPASGQGTIPAPEPRSKVDRLLGALKRRTDPHRK